MERPGNLRLKIHNLLQENTENLLTNVDVFLFVSQWDILKCTCMADCALFSQNIGTLFHLVVSTDFKTNG